MPISMYQASAPRFANTLKNLSAILGKAQAHCEARATKAKRLFINFLAFLFQQFY